ncbi:MAG TPA: flagellar hook-basal body complex protein [Candidatus Limnocylindria bacterium]|nr:flagellar hook-basal body complex protein [Candidatus Limnocylindria bacterium]
MLSSLNTGLSGLQQYQGLLDTVGNNIANSGTVGYKAVRTTFEDNFSQQLEESNYGSAGIQLGTGVATAATTSDFSQGGFQTGIATDVAIDGNGFFVVKNATTGAEYATRAGNFHLDSSNYLVTETGERVQGSTDGTAKGDLKLDPATDTTLTGYSIGPDGSITVKLSDGTSASRGQLLLQNFRTPQALRKEGNNLYSGLTEAGPLGGADAAAGADVPGTKGLGSIKTGVLEASNVDLPTEFVNLITAQRGFQANSRVITTSDDILQEIVSLKR